MLHKKHALRYSMSAAHCNAKQNLFRSAKYAAIYTDQQ